MKSWVHAQLDDPPQAVAVLLNEVGKRAVIPGSEPLEQQANGFSWRVIHDLASIFYLAHRRRFGTKMIEILPWILVGGEAGAALSGRIARTPTSWTRRQKWRINGKKLK
jgi:hypothetical protein